MKKNRSEIIAWAKEQVEKIIEDAIYLDEINIETIASSIRKRKHVAERVALCSVLVSGILAINNYKFQFQMPATSLCLENWTQTKRNLDKRPKMISFYCEDWDNKEYERIFYIPIFSGLEKVWT